MNKYILLVFLAIPGLLSAQENLNFVLPPDFLVIQNGLTPEAKQMLAHVNFVEETLVEIVIATRDDEHTRFLTRIINARVRRDKVVYCDGAYRTIIEQSGRVYFELNSINICFDDDGELVGYQIGLDRELTHEELDEMSENLRLNVISLLESLPKENEN